MAWAAAPALHNLLVQDMEFAYTDIDLSVPRDPGKVTSVFDGDPNYSAISAGDIIFFYQNGPGSPNHAGFIVGWGPPVNNQGELDFDAASAPWFADHGGADHIRPINDISRPSPIARVILMEYDTVSPDHPIFQR